MTAEERHRNRYERDAKTGLTIDSRAKVIGLQRLPGDIEIAKYPT